MRPHVAALLTVAAVLLLALALGPGRRPAPEDSGAEAGAGAASADAATAGEDVDDEVLRAEDDAARLADASLQAPPPLTRAEREAAFRAEFHRLWIEEGGREQSAAAHRRATEMMRDTAQGRRLGEVIAELDAEGLPSGTADAALLQDLDWQAQSAATTQLVNQLAHGASWFGDMDPSIDSELAEHMGARPMEFPPDMHADLLSGGRARALLAGPEGVVDQALAAELRLARDQGLRDQALAWSELQRMNEFVERARQDSGLWRTPKVNRVEGWEELLPEYATAAAAVQAAEARYLENVRAALAGRGLLSTGQ